MLQDEFLAAYGQLDVGGSTLCSQSVFFPRPTFVGVRKEFAAHRYNWQE